jgi:hypothetical protein
VEIDVPGVTLEELLARSIRMGQRRVALQRLLMLEARGLPVAAEHVSFCREMRTTVPRRELQRMQQAADEWARLVSGRDRTMYLD